jgi:hypothetical protein
VRPVPTWCYSTHPTVPSCPSTIQFGPTRPTRIPSLGRTDSDTKCNAPGPTHGLGPLYRGVSLTCVANSLAFLSSLRTKRLTEGYYMFLAWLFKLVWPYLRFQYSTKSQANSAPGRYSTHMYSPPSTKYLISSDPIWCYSTCDYNPPWPNAIQFSPTRPMRGCYECLVCFLGRHWSDWAFGLNWNFGSAYLAFWNFGFQESRIDRFNKERKTDYFGFSFLLWFLVFKSLIGSWRSRDLAMHVFGHWLARWRLQPTGAN